MNQPTQDNRRFRGQRHRGKGKEEEEAVFTLDEWEKRKGSMKPSTANNSYDISRDEEIARQLQNQLVFEDYQTIECSDKHLKQAKAILSSTSELQKSEFPCPMLSADKEKLIPEKGKDRPQERRPGLGRKRAQFSFKPNTSQPALDENLNLNIDQLQDPEEFFAAPSSCGDSSKGFMHDNIDELTNDVSRLKMVNAELKEKLMVGAYDLRTLLQCPMDWVPDVPDLSQVVGPTQGPHRVPNPSGYKAEKGTSCSCTRSSACQRSKCDCVRMEEFCGSNCKCSSCDNQIPNGPGSSSIATKSRSFSRCKDILKNEIEELSDYVCELIRENEGLKKKLKFEKTVWCKCSSGSECKRRSCDCHEIGENCGPGCGCKPKKCTNRK